VVLVLLHAGMATALMVAAVAVLEPLMAEKAAEAMIVVMAGAA